MSATKSIDLTGRIMTHDELAKTPDRGTSGQYNELFFEIDFKSNLLDKYRGTAVLYWKGILCGQGPDPKELFKKAENYYGQSNLTVFVVPQKEEKHITVVDAYTHLKDFQFKYNLLQADCKNS